MAELILHAYWHGCYYLEITGMVHQELTTMNRISNRPVFHHKLHLYILRRLVIIANILCLSIYIFLRIIFYDLPFVPKEELLIAVNIMGWATATAVAISFVLFAGHALTYLIRNRKQFDIPALGHIPEPSANKNSGV